jgi:pectin methylesterase-like acyl-CoA thioesterase/lysophospholipase L1-like esterase
LRVVLVGDSTMAPRTGYGDAFCGLFHWQVDCVNLGRGGRSTRSYRADGSWERVDSLLRAKARDRDTYVLVQLGHNDQPGKAERTTDLATEYPANLARYVAEIREHGAFPVLVTPLTRRRFVEGRLVRDLEPWARAMAQVAQAHDVPLLDLHEASARAVEAMGPQAADALAELPPPSPRFDRTHLGPRGAAYFARMLAERMRHVVPDSADGFVVGAVELPGRIERPQLADREAEGYSRDAVLRGWDPAAPRPVALRLRVDASAASDARTFPTVQAAIDAAVGAKVAGRVVIQVAAGTYEERIDVPPSAPPLTLESMAADAAAVRIRYRVAATDLSAVARIRSRGFHLRHVTIENTHNKDTGDRRDHIQAVALRLDDADEAHLEGVRLLGFQDTLYLRATSREAPARTFVERSYVEGDMDFIFGEGTAYFVDTEIRSLGDRAVSYTLAPSTHAASRHGFVFEGCRFTHDVTPNALAGTFKLARQWNRSPAHVGKVAILRSSIGAHIDRERPWADWSIGTPRHRPVQYHSPEGEPYLAEYRNTGEAP